MSFYLIEHIEQGTTEWLNWRKGVIGASDAPTIMGENPWRSPSYLLKEKLGNHKEWGGNEALRDGVITVQEREMIEKVGAALHLPVIIPDTAQPIKVNSDNLSVGKKVCFTGSAIGFNGEQISREDLEALAAKVGLHPVNGVTKKGCDVLVAADESSMSGKAKKAKDWGIPVISVEKFITFCTFG